MDVVLFVCVISYVRERGGEVDESGEVVDEVNVYKGILDRI